MEPTERIDKIYAFVGTNSQGHEGVGTFYHEGLNQYLPLLGDQKMVDYLRPFAIEMANEIGITITLVEFTTRTELEVFEPKHEYKEEAGV